MSLNVGILGATGYTGVQLLSLLIKHPDVRISWLTSEKFAGQKIQEVFPHLRNFSDLVCTSVARLKDLEKVDLVFSCLPHGTSMRFVAKYLNAGARVIDFSRDFRFRDSRIYKDLFNKDHEYKDYLKGAVYGLPEINRELIKGSSIVANPGCYSTAVILALAPLAQNGLMSGGSVIADIKAGLSGGGRAPTLGHHFSEANETLYPASVSGHDQEPEMELELSKLAGSPVRVTFVPHTVSITRGILATMYCVSKEKADYERIYELYETRYRGEAFVSLMSKGQFPAVKDVTYSNMCRIGIDVRDDMIITVAALDNLGKGAASQAVQNMNIMFGFPETRGLTGSAMYP